VRVRMRVCMGVHSYRMRMRWCRYVCRWRSSCMYKCMSMYMCKCRCNTVIVVGVGVVVYVSVCVCTLGIGVEMRPLIMLSLVILKFENNLS